jgi:hypothetical protein
MRKEEMDVKEKQHGLGVEKFRRNHKERVLLSLAGMMETDTTENVYKYYQELCVSAQFRFF